MASELFPDEGQADLETENTPDGMDGEQTWPTEEELREAEMEGKLLYPLIIFDPKTFLYTLPFSQ